ncbi:LLM class flavin-dependent oxidoreductase [Streptomyces noursei]|nr:LLM class flavin-dependent oxidoreductase [Streptomyces noursei]UWS69855.1 LLM class flavin-dependent oxidoreductase [Streptomyces noursei]UWS76926.1 LLM class flavin-dependent oxidoreductase [Streptomyces noursei]
MAGRPLREWESQLRSGPGISRPVQPELPVWLTSGGTAETFRAAATAKAGVLTHLLHQDVDQLATNIAEYRAKMRATYPDWSGHVVVMLHSFLAETRESARAAVHQPLRDYLRSSLELVARSMRDVGPDFDVRSLEEEDLDFVLERAFSMYFNERGIFGTVDDAVPLVERLREIGVDEIACLIDFGVDVELALEGLHRIDALRRRFAAGGEAVNISDIHDNRFRAAVEQLKVPGMGTEQVGPFLYQLLQLFRPRHVLEVGMGYTTPFIAAALASAEAQSKTEILGLVAKTKRHLHGDDLSDDWLIDEPALLAPGEYLEPHLPCMVAVDDLSIGQSSASRAHEVLRELGLDRYVEVVNASLHEAESQIVQSLPRLTSLG